MATQSWQQILQAGRATSLAAVMIAGVVGVTVPANGQQLVAQSSQDRPAVKKSRRDICHERGTISYVQTIYFEPFESMEACLASGGRLSGTVPEAPGAETRSSEPRPAKGTWYGHYAVYVLASSVCAILLIGGLVWRFWFRRNARRQIRTFEQRQERAWQGHRLESKKPLRPVK